jgi:hypothetical protein
MLIGSMRTTPLLGAGLATLTAFLITVGACQGRERAPAPTPAQPDYKPTATIRELMHSVIDPSADVVWLSVQILWTEGGTVEIRPQTDEEWASVRRGAIILLESANLLMIPGRPVAHPGEKSVAPGVELEPDEIAGLIEEDRNAWNARAIVLHEVAASVIEAIDAKDANKVFNLGEEIEAVCESCHRQYWYPGEVIPTFPADAQVPGEASNRPATKIWHRRISLPETTALMKLTAADTLSLRVRAE